MSALSVEAKTRKGGVRNCLVQVSSLTLSDQLCYILSIQDVTMLKRERDTNRYETHVLAASLLHRLAQSNSHIFH
jgi:hypothetical protein